jgi:hypothetical protein
MKPLENLKDWISAFVGMTGYGKKHGVVLLLSATLPRPKVCGKGVSGKEVRDI